MDTVSKFTLPGLLLLLTLVFGFWLSLSGKPYNALLFNVHKLVALAAVVFIVIRIVQALKGIPPQALVIAMLVLAGLCVLALFITGALMSVGIPQYSLILTIHRVALVLLPLALVGTLYLFAGGGRA